jgi:hypothetical protein
MNNEQIKQLTRQALAECQAHDIKMIHANMLDKYGIVEIPQCFSERFAELIVRECSDIILHRAGTSADYFDDVQANAHARQVQRDCAQTLRLSFGLEIFGEQP